MENDLGTDILNILIRYKVPALIDLRRKHDYRYQEPKKVLVFLLIQKYGFSHQMVADELDIPRSQVHYLRDAGKLLHTTYAEIAHTLLNNPTSLKELTDLLLDIRYQGYLAGVHDWKVRRPRRRENSRRGFTILPPVVNNAPVSS